MKFALLALIISAQDPESTTSSWHVAAAKGDLVLAAKLAKASPETRNDAKLIRLLEGELAQASEPRNGEVTTPALPAETRAAAWEAWGTEALLGASDEASIYEARVALQLAVKTCKARPQDSLLRLAEAHESEEGEPLEAGLRSAAVRLGWKVFSGKVLENISGNHVLVPPGRYRLEAPVMIPPETELLLVGGTRIYATNPEAGLIIHGHVRCLTTSESRIELTGRTGWAGWQFHGSGVAYVRDLTITRASCALKAVKGSLLADGLIVEGCEQGIWANAVLLSVSNSRFEKCTEFGVSTYTNGGNRAICSHCEFARNEVGAQTTFRQHLYVLECSFKRNEVPLWLHMGDGRITARGCNFDRKAPVKIPKGVASDLRGNWWGTPKPRLARIVEPANGTAAIIEPHLSLPSESAGRR